jgi:hypothetical protein
MSDEQVAMSVLEVLGGKGKGKGEDEVSWQAVFQAALDETDLDLRTGPLWRLTAVPEGEGERTALVLAFNHAISDQISTNSLIHELMHSLADEIKAKKAGQVSQGPVREPLLAVPSHAHTVPSVSRHTRLRGSPWTRRAPRLTRRCSLHRWKRRCWGARAWASTPSAICCARPPSARCP